MLVSSPQKSEFAFTQQEQHLSRTSPELSPTSSGIFAESKMSIRLFEEKEHAAYYQKFRIEPSQEIIDIILGFLHERLPRPNALAVDVGCGTGQNTRVISPYFEKVHGIDISSAQIEEAKKAPGSPNVTYSVGLAEEMPLDDASVDLVTACAAAHWFNMDKFVKEVDRILKPRGCLAIYSYLPYMEVHYQDRSEQMTRVFADMENILTPYRHERFERLPMKGYKEIFEAIPYTDKRSFDRILTKIKLPLASLMGFVESRAMYQAFLSIKPEKAKEMMTTTEQRFLQIMGTSSRDTVVELWHQNILVLASKPQ